MKLKMKLFTRHSCYTTKRLRMARLQLTGNRDKQLHGNAFRCAVAYYIISIYLFVTHETALDETIAEKKSISKKNAAEGITMKRSPMIGLRTRRLHMHMKRLRK